MELREAKQHFFALRNGLLADSLRKQCSLPHKLIFGLNIIQLREIATMAGKDSALAEALWADSDCRESRLLAPMVAPEPQPQWLSEVRSAEEADILCHASLRRHPDAEAIAVKAAASENPLLSYAGLRLLLNLLPGAKDSARKAIETLSAKPLTAGIASQLRQEIEFLSEQ
ncbi:MAG: hypothetical protein K2O38_04920 [Muribaculaceae bacterium]|nr:hypothetical protein [Muribaculaceae bacterium]